MKLSILLPAHNEEKAIRACIESCLNQTRKPDQIVVVNDGSTDRTQRILKSFGKKIEVITVYPAGGTKSKAQEKGIPHINGDVFITTDADTILDKRFVERIEKDFEDPSVAAVGGYVRSLRINRLTACRAYDYSVGQNIHKRAQDILEFMLVIPGAASAFRTAVFRKNIKFDHDTVTEDLDTTYRFHKKGLRIKYDREAIVYTQDPENFHSYINQMRRWYGGGWQNLKKHWSADLFDDPRRMLELSLVYVEGLVYSVLLFLIPLINIQLGLQLIFVLFFFVVLQSIYAAVKERRMDLLLVPLLYLSVMHINAWVFIEQFVRQIILRKTNQGWFFIRRVNIDQSMT
ncbi:MAG: glycosyltransferase [Candidatus Dojkabacteria bacterium]|nr:glycosyltransferase [Candidatus Dojkabacteria bacterium]